MSSLNYRVALKEIHVGGTRSPKLVSHPLMDGLSPTFFVHKGYYNILSEEDLHVFGLADIENQVCYSECIRVY